MGKRVHVLFSDGAGFWVGHRTHCVLMNCREVSRNSQAIRAIVLYVATPTECQNTNQRSLRIIVWRLHDCIHGTLPSIYDIVQARQAVVLDMNTMIMARSSI